MKKLILILACLAAGVAASIALASPQRAAEGTTTAATATTTAPAGDHHGKGDDGDHHGKGDDGDHHGNGGDGDHKDGKPASQCRGVEIRGTVAAGSLTVAVTRADPNAGVGSSATFAVSGSVKVHGRLCGTTLTLQSLEVKPAKPAAPPAGTTTTPTTASTTTSTTP